MCELNDDDDDDTENEKQKTYINYIHAEVKLNFRLFRKIYTQIWTSARIMR